MDATGGMWKKLALWALDVACVLISYQFAIWIRFGASGETLEEQRTGKILLLILLVLVTFISLVVRNKRGLMKRTLLQEIGVVFTYNLLLLVGIAILVLALQVQPIPSRLMLLYFFIISTFIMTVMRTAAKAAARAVFKSERVGSSVVMVVEGSVRDEVQNRFETGATYAICGWLEYTNGMLNGTVRDFRVSTPAEKLPSALHGMDVSDIFVCTPTASDRETTAIVDSAERMGASCHVAINVLDPSIQGAALDRFGGVPTISFTGKGSKIYRNVVKRAIDIVVSLLIVILAVIPGAILSLVISLQSRGAPIYTEERLGLNGKPFKLLKFRSMFADADDVEKYFSSEQLKEWQTERKVDNDPRVTKVGRFLRKTSLDEFPQFVNVLKGDMSIVGPRPIVVEELVNYGDRADEFLSCRPGVTGWWQVEARNKADYASGRRQELELYYVRHASFTLDWNIFVRTFGAVFHGTGK